MPNVIKISDQNALVPTKDFPYANWPFKDFNPVQSRLLETYDKEANIAIAASTSAGKTVCAEMYMSYEVRKRGGKALYIGPLKALAKEKEQDWTGKKRPHHFNDLATSICTGDYRITKSRVDELDASDLIVMTPEMLASRIRNHKSEKSRFLQEIGTAVIDESHLLTVPNRGDHIEIAMMKLSEINPNCRFVLLSATMPNVDEICGWTTKLTGRDTYYLESEYRPCPLNIHYECYYDGDDSYDGKEAAKVGAAAGIVEYYSQDKFLVFVHTKRTGQMMVKMLNRCGIEAEFHNADLGLEERIKLEDRFKEDKDFKVVVATPTLAWGVNLPARRVIIVGVHRGLERVENYNIRQEIGRAGRLGLDDQGDAYILVPESTKKETIAELRKVEPIRSTLLIKEAGRHNKVLAFHAVSEIFYRNITTQEGFHHWFERTLAHYQDQDFDDAEIDNTISLLQQYKAVKVNEEGEYECTPVGKIASLFYYSPFDVCDLRRNFHFLFESKKEENDFSVAMAMGNIDSFRWGVTNRNERQEMAGFQLMVERMYGKGVFSECAIKTGFAYYNMLLGKHNVTAFHALQAGLYADLDRTMEVMHAVNSMATVWDRKGFFDGLQVRLKYGVTSDLVELCSLPNIGQARAKKLKALGLKSAEDVMSQDPDALAKIMRCNVKLAEEAVEGAKKLIARRLVD